MKYERNRYKILIVVPKYNWPSKEKDYNYQSPVGLAYISVALKNADVLMPFRKIYLKLRELFNENG